MNELLLLLLLLLLLGSRNSVTGVAIRLLPGQSGIRAPA